MTGSPGATVVVASNRGPLSFTIAENGVLTARRGGGGLVSGLSAIGDENALWICAALSDADHTAARRAPRGRLDLAGHDTGTSAVRMLEIDPSTLSRAYNGIANSTLWFVHHMLYDTATAPVFDSGQRRQWVSYETYNAAFADALAADAGEGALALIQDYHLTLAPRQLRDRRPDLRIAHFSHTPWAPVEYYRMLPDAMARAVLEGILGADHAGFLSIRWARAFVRCCAEILGAEVDEEKLTVTHEGRTTHVAVHALGVDGPFLRNRAAQPDVEAKIAALRETLGDARVIVRVDRTELSKNIVRGLLAYREMLVRHPEVRGRVVHVAFAYPSRHDLPEYREYTAAVQRVAKEIEDEFATDSWRPLVLHVDDDFARSLAAYRIADVLLVNPVRDGMNLVAKEVPVVSERGCALVLSREAGAFDELGADAIAVNPFDVVATADALHEALVMDDSERADRCHRLAAAATALSPARWFADQVTALERGL